jgi:hypothetical protein
MKLEQPLPRIYATVMALVGWFALFTQYYVNYDLKTVSAAEYTLRYFSFFTILTNIMVASTYTAIALGGKSFLTRTKSITAVTLYIVMVGIIYNTVLRNLVELQGVPLIVDRLLHSIIPVSLLIFWMFIVPREGLQWSYAISFLWYPVCYILYVIILGELTGFYPYPFANVEKLGYPRAIINGMSICVGFLIAALLFIAIGRKSRRS